MNSAIATAIGNTLPAPGANGTALVSVNGEWTKTPGYGYSVTEDSFVLGEFTSADFTQEDAEYKATIPLTSDLLTLLQRMFINHEEFNVTINSTTYNSVADQFTYTEDPSIYLQDVFRLEPNSGYTALTFSVPTVPSSARIYGSVTTYTQFDRRLLPEQELNVKNGIGNGSIVVSGNNEASFNKATGNHSVAEGYATIAGSSASHTEGYYSMAVNGYTGYGSNSNANHSEGYSTASVGIGSHSEGSSDYYVEHIYITGDENATELSYEFSTGATRQLNNRIIGAYLIYNGEDADSDGAFYRITGLDSSRQIIQVSSGHPAFSNASFRIIDNFAVGNGAHTEGEGTQAFRNSSHAEGLKTIANGEAQHVQGKYNIEDTNNTYAHIVGNGTSNTRSNAHTLDWNGNAWYAGKVTADGTPTNANDLTTKQYVDNAINGSTVSVSGTTPTVTAIANTMYVCGEVSTLSFTPAVTGISDIIFESGSTATVLTVPNTVKFPDWFDATALEPNMVYEISIMNGTYGAVMAWATT